MQAVKEFRRTLMFVALAAAPMAAANAAGELDAYYTPYAALKLDGGSSQDYKFDDGDGWGVKGKFGLAGGLFLSGEYEQNDYDDITVNGTPILGFPTDLDLSVKTKQYRAGLGYNIGETPFYALGEYVRLDSKLRADDGTSATESDKDVSEGWGAHLGAKGKVLSDYVTLNAEIGYVDIGNVDGLEVLGGLAFNVTKHFGVFADYRLTSLTGGSNDPDTRLEEARVGVRASF